MKAVADPEEANVGDMTLKFPGKNRQISSNHTERTQNMVISTPEVTISSERSESRNLTHYSIYFNYNNLPRDMLGSVF